MKEVATYLTFNGDCREAMQFYQHCLGGELYVMPFSEAKFEYPKEAKDRIIHARLASGPAILMASDTMPGMPFQQGSNFSICIGCDSVPELERLFAALGDGGKVTMPLQDTFWNARFGMVTDRFGIGWMFNFDKGQQR